MNMRGSAMRCIIALYSFFYIPYIVYVIWFIRVHVSAQKYSNFRHEMFKSPLPNVQIFITKCSNLRPQMFKSMRQR